MTTPTTTTASLWLRLLIAFSLTNTITATYSSNTFSLFVTAAAAAAVAAAAATPQQKNVDFYNGYSKIVTISWINPVSQERALMNNGVDPNEKSVMNSYQGHTFEIKQKDCQQQQQQTNSQSDCLSTTFTVSDLGHEVVELTNDFTTQRFTAAEYRRLIHQRTHTQPDCRAIVMQQQQQQQQINTIDYKDITTALAECFHNIAATNITLAKQQLFYEQDLRKKEAELYENATCSDYTTPSSSSSSSSPPILNNTWLDQRTGNTHPVSIFLDRPASRVHVIENFITPTECQAMEQQAQPKLMRAVVADGAGGHEFSESRRAMQAGIKVPWEQEPQQHPITTISRRVYDYVNHVTGLQIQEHGQENLMSIQYFGKGLDSNITEADQYKPHCDGDCTGDPHKFGTRVATMVVYCTVPQLGGATNFRNSGITIRAKAGSGIFFSYMDPNTHIMDDGFTEHSGCPVIQGQKKIVTQWVRYGVTQDVPWTSYNSLGILKSKAEEQDQ